MPFCPECRFEFIDGAQQCPNCGVVLVDRLPTMQRPSAPRDYQESELCTLTGEIHARLLQDMLLSQGIPSRLQSAWPFDSPYGVLLPPSPLGGGQSAVLKVIVRDSDLDRARVVCADFEGHTGDGSSAQPKRRRKRTV